MRTAIVLQLLLINAIAVGLVRSSSQIKAEFTPAEKKLWNHIETNGGYIKFAVGRACPTCLRGVVATKNFVEDDLIMAIPLELGILLSPIPRLGFPAEYAYDLVQRIQLDPKFNASFSAYFDSLPSPEDVLSAESITDDLLELVHSPEVVRLLTMQRSVAHDIYNGTLQWGNYTALPDIFHGTEASVSREQFAYLSSLVGTRDFTLSSDTLRIYGEDKIVEDDSVNFDDIPVSWMLPVIDLINHSDEPNAHRSDNGTHVLVHATKDISIGEEITNNYQPGVIYRNDMSLHIYGFIQEVNALNLCATDLPTYNPDAPYDETEPDFVFYGPEGEYNTPEEIERLQKLLKAAEEKSSIENDEALLKSGALKNWKEETIVKFRMYRKRALKNAIKVIEDEIAKGNNSNHIKKDEL